MNSFFHLRWCLGHAAFALVILLCSCATKAEPPAFDGARALADVKTQVDFGPRIPGQDGHQRCADWLSTELGRYAATVRRQAFYHVVTDSAAHRSDTMYLSNLIVSFNPRSTRRLAISAHWDSRKWADEDPDTSKRSQPVPGANDGASGVAVCLELARIMAVLEPPMGVDLLLFDGEDQGARGNVDEYLLGSRWFASQAHNYRPLAVILLDMIGDSSLNISREAYSDSLSPGLNDLIWSIADSLGTGGFVDTVGYHVIDDHLPFLLNGIPAADLIDFDYPSWHTTTDTPDKVSAQSLATIGRILTALVYHTSADALDDAVRKRSR